MRLLVFICLSIFADFAIALSVPPACMFLDEKRKVSFVKKRFNESVLVLSISKPIEKLDSWVTKREVLGVWKGEIGQYVYVNEHVVDGIIFADYQTENVLSVSNDMLHYCPYVEDVLISEFGSPNKPDEDYFRLNHASNLLLWSMLFVFIIFTFVNLGMSKWIQLKSITRDNPLRRTR